MQISRNRLDLSRNPAPFQNKILCTNKMNAGMQNVWKARG